MPFKSFVAGEILTASDVNTFLGAQAISVFADATARDAAITSPVTGQFAFRTDDDTLEFWDGSTWQEYKTGAPSAVVSSTTGSPATGTFTDSNGFSWQYYDFTGNGSITFSEAGYADCLVLGGGGGGRDLGSNRFAGGGSGRIIYGLHYVGATTYAVTIGAGGASGAGNGFSPPGGLTSLGSLIQAGGGNGAAGGDMGFQNASGFGGPGGGVSRTGSVNTFANGAGAGSGANGQTLNYNGSSLEYGRGGFSAITPIANRGDGGRNVVGGSSGRLIVKVLA